MVYSMLIFLEISPTSQFEDTATDVDAYKKISDDNFAAFIACVGTDDERIRSLTSSVARKFLNDGSTFLLRESLQAENFRLTFWERT